MSVQGPTCPFIQEDLSSMPCQAQQAIVEHVPGCGFLVAQDCSKR